MSFTLTLTEPYDLVELQNEIKRKELDYIRLTNLTGKTQNGRSFNVLEFTRVFDNALPFSKLFVVYANGNAGNDPTVKTWLAQNPRQNIVCEDQVYVSGSLENIAVVR